LVPLGAGRFGRLPAATKLAALADRGKAFLRIERLQTVGDLHQDVQWIAVACGSAGEFLEPARRRGCDALVTGETNFHTCLEAEATGMALLLPGHYASERFAVERLAEVLAGQFPELQVWASRKERDPIQTI
jgi:putative NIF3 family GTP cyclohydrolase 1 type 2